MDKDEYTNGQKIFEIIDDELIYYFKNGKIKARGKFINDKMEGEWLFYKLPGRLWQIGNFKNNMKHGKWIRYDDNEEIEYSEEFIEGKKIKN